MKALSLLTNQSRIGGMKLNPASTKGPGAVDTWVKLQSNLPAVTQRSAVPAKEAAVKSVQPEKKFQIEQLLMVAPANQFEANVLSYSLVLFDAIAKGDMQVAMFASKQIDLLVNNGNIEMMMIMVSAKAILNALSKGVSVKMVAKA